MGTNTCCLFYDAVLSEAKMMISGGGGYDAGKWGE